MGNSYRLEGFDGVLCYRVPGKVVLSIIDCDSARSTGIAVEVARVHGYYWHTVVGAVLMLEI